MSYETIISFSLKFEGGYCFDKDDKGGETNKGITKVTYDAYRTSNKLPIQSVKLISDKEINDIYYNRYWLAAGCDKLEDKLAMVVLDFSINSGVSRAVKYLTLTTDPMKYIAFRETFLNDIVKHNPSQQKFLRGWLNRTAALKKLIA